MKVNQFVSNFCFGDAISNNVRTIQKKFFERGIAGEIFTQFPDEYSKNSSIFFKDYKGNPENVLIMHGSTYSEIFDYIRGLPDKKALIYHNITPPSFFEGYSDFFVNHLTKGLSQMKNQACVFDLALGVSDFNCEALKELGLKNVSEIPLYFDFSRLEKGFSSDSLKNVLSDSGKNILFVGRFAPNKKQDDLIKAFYVYRKYFDEKAHLILSGDFVGMENYFSKILALIKELNLENFVKITGKISDFDLNFLYKNCDLFLSMSEHEGFFVPILESYYFGLPVMSFSAGAIPETMGEGGIIFDTKDFAFIAEKINQVLNDRALLNTILQKQKSSLSKFISLNDDFKLFDFIKNL